MTGRLSVGGWGAACLVVVIVALSATSASGHLRDSEGLYFKGRTSNSSGNLLDPVNLLFMGGSHPEELLCPASGCTDPNGNPTVIATICDTATHETSRCVGHILKHGGIRHSCGSKQYVVMRTASNTRVREPMTLSRVTNRFCLTQLHIRAFSDRGHGHPENNRQWMVGGAHRERALRVRCRTSAGPPRCRAELGHRIYKSWEMAEDESVDRIGRTQCTYRNVLRVPGSTGKRREIRGWFSDGRASRISMKKINRSAQRGQRCTGG